MKNSYQHSRTYGGPELLSARENQPDILRLFEDILLNGTDLRVRVTGISMMPFLKGGEVLTIRKTPSVYLKKGDLILFRNSYDAPVLHRVIKKHKSNNGAFRFLTKGDALAAFDEEINGDSVLGKVCEIKRPGSSGKFKHIDMNSTFRKCAGLLIAASGFYKARACSLLVDAIRRKRSCFSASR